MPNYVAKKKDEDGEVERGIPATYDDKSVSIVRARKSVVATLSDFGAEQLTARFNRRYHSRWW
jgi:hypothetical protein